MRRGPCQIVVLSKCFHSVPERVCSSVDRQSEDREKQERSDDSRRFDGLSRLRLAQNLNQELQIGTTPAERGATLKRAPFWGSVELATMRHRLIKRARRLTRPSGVRTLRLGGNETVENELVRLLDAVDEAA